MNDLMEHRQCEELTSDDLLEAYNESVLEDVLREQDNTLTPADVDNISNGLLLQSLYLKFLNAEGWAKTLLAHRIWAIIGKDRQARTKDWTAQQRQEFYYHQEAAFNAHRTEPEEFCPF